MDQSAESAKLRNLVNEFISGNVDTLAFCEQFELMFNLEVDKGKLNEPEMSSFSKLFETVIWYSPYPAERREIPNYRDEQEVFDAAKRVVDELKGGR